MYRSVNCNQPLGTSSLVLKYQPIQRKYLKAFFRNQPRLRHHPRQPRHRHRAPAGKIHRLRQRNTALPPRHRHHGRVAGAELQLPHRAAGTRQPAPSHPEGTYILTCFLQVPASCCKRSNALPRKKQCFVPKKAMFCTQTLPHFAHISFKLS